MSSSFQHSRSRRGAAAALAAAVVGGALAATVPAQAIVPSAGLSQAAAPSGRLTNFGFNATSYGSKTTGNPDAASDATAASYLGCSRYVPRGSSNFISRTGDRNGVTVRDVRTHNFSTDAGPGTSTISVVHIAGGRFGTGNITFSDLKGRVQSFHDSTGFHTRTLSSLGSLELNGVAIPIPAGGRETTIPLPDGTLTLNRQIRHVNGSRASGFVNVMRYERNDGTIQKIGRAYARIDDGVTGGAFRGAAWGSDARTANKAALGRGALQPMPCAGTDGKVRETATGRATPSFGFIGARRSFVFGQQHANSASGYSRSVIDKASLGALEFRNIRTKANVNRMADGRVVRSARGTRVGEILVAGQPIQQPAPGQSRKVAGLGTFTLRTVHRSPNGIDVTGVIVRLFNGTPNDQTDDTVVNLGRATLKISKG